MGTQAATLPITNSARRAPRETKAPSSANVSRDSFGHGLTIVGEKGFLKGGERS
jgi:hypothetical protein